MYSSKIVAKFPINYDTMSPESFSWQSDKFSLPPFFMAEKICRESFISVFVPTRLICKTNTIIHVETMSFLFKSSVYWRSFHFAVELSTIQLRSIKFEKIIEINCLLGSKSFVTVVHSSNFNLDYCLLTWNTHDNKFFENFSQFSKF